MDARKEAICNALAAFIRQRPGLDWRDYATSNYTEQRRAYAADQRRIACDKRDAETLLQAVRRTDGITADDMLRVADGGGRLKISRVPGASYAGPETGGSYAPVYRVRWTAGQFWATEYRPGVARYCAQLLWDWQLGHMPEPGTAPIGSGKARDGMYWDAGANKAVSAGDWLRRKFRQEFGSALQKRWFD